MSEALNGNGNGHDKVRAARAAAAGLRVGESALSLLAKERNLTVPQLKTHLSALLLGAAEAGDVSAARELDALSIGPILQLHRAKTSGHVYKRIAAAFSLGLLSPDQAVRSLKFVEVKRSLEVSDLDRRLRKLELTAGSVAGTVIPRQEVDDA